MRCFTVVHSNTESPLISSKMVWLGNVNDIQFSQNSIGCKFSNGDSIVQLAEDYINNRIDLNDLNQMRPIAVIRRSGVLYAMKGNRRLYVYKKLSEYGYLEDDFIPIRYYHGRFKPFTAIPGQPLIIRGEIDVESEIDDLLSGNTSSSSSSYGYDEYYY